MLRTSIAKKHYIFVIFPGGGGGPDPRPPHMDPLMQIHAGVIYIYCMFCASERGRNPRAKASGLSSCTEAQTIQ